MLFQALGRGARLAVPRIGFYGAHAVDPASLTAPRPDTLVILDYGIPRQEVEKLLELSGAEAAVVVDHHLSDAMSGGRVKVYNPSSSGGKQYPSTTWVLRELLHDAPDLPSVLGVAGDLEERMMEHWSWPQVSRVLDENGWRPEALVLLGRMVSACYKALDYECVLRAPRKLLVYGSDLEAALEDEEWRRTFKSVAEEAARLLRGAEPEKVGGVLVYRFSSKYYLSSELGRTLSRLHPDMVVVVYYERGDGYVEIYVRSWQVGLAPALEGAREAGLPAGGKNEVFAVQLPRSMGEEALSTLLEILGKLLETRPDSGVPSKR